MAGTVTPDIRMNATPTLLRHVASGMKVSFGELVLDDSYVENGETCAIPGIGTANVVFVLLSSEDGYVFSFNRANSKVLAYYNDLSAGTDSAMIQVATSVDLSGVTVDYLAFGY